MGMKSSFQKQSNWMISLYVTFFCIYLLLNYKTLSVWDWERVAHCGAFRDKRIGSINHSFKKGNCSSPPTLVRIPPFSLNPFCSMESYLHIEVEVVIFIWTEILMWTTNFTIFFQIHEKLIIGEGSLNHFIVELKLIKEG
jgi:hypothetical protein